MVNLLLFGDFGVEVMGSAILNVRWLSKFERKETLSSQNGCVADDDRMRDEKKEKGESWALRVYGTYRKWQSWLAKRRRGGVTF